MRDPVRPGGRAEWEARVAGTVRGTPNRPREVVVMDEQERDLRQDPQPEGGFTPREGTRDDGGWRPAEHPHGDPEPGPSVEDDPGARGPQARSALPANPPVPPEAGERLADEGGPGPDPGES